MPENNDTGGVGSKGVDAVGLTLVVFAAIVVAGGLFGVSEIVSARSESLDGLSQRSEIVRNVGLFLLGIIGLPLAIWRSWIAKRQVDETIAQGLRTEKQLQHAEKQLRLGQASENLGFLEKGGSLLEADKSSSRATGVHMLEAILKQDDEVAVRAAGNILYQFIRHHDERGKIDYYLASVALLGHLGRSAAEGETDARALESEGNSEVYLVNAHFRNINFVRTVDLQDCRIEHSILINKGAWIRDCNVQDSLVLKISEESKNNEFIRCDFSGADFTCDIEGSKFEGCYYHAGHPPTEATLSLLGDYLDLREGLSEKLLLN
ncbi:hypothetical protein HRR99_03180 [Agrobacterium vaccinii]|uniref:hypothetical protein n=1 Tax=Agrobacterium vaccinii TaxID=2735528 RepID=UPI001E5AE430|nr:hypothetical protein [Agrobacterium vaccinii]UHS60592.1 hypothetical protein HRR99_03180 [Agrobacterium vaccinii]